MKEVELFTKKADLRVSVLKWHTLLQIIFFFVYNENRLAKSAWILVSPEQENKNHNDKKTR